MYSSYSYSTSDSVSSFSDQSPICSGSSSSSLSDRLLSIHHILGAPVFQTVLTLSLSLCSPASAVLDLHRQDDCPCLRPGSSLQCLLHSLSENIHHYIRFSFWICPYAILTLVNVTICDPDLG